MNTEILLYILCFVGGVLLTGLIMYFAGIRRKNGQITDLKIATGALESDKKHLEADAERLRGELQMEKEASVAQKAESEQKMEAALKKAENQSREQIKEQMETLKLTFEKSATELFEKRSKDLNESNTNSMSSIIDPLKEQMKHFKDEVEAAKKQSSDDSAALKERIRELMQQSVSLGQEADNLAKALRSNNKIQGNWGENHLINILEKAGFHRGEDFETQVLLRDTGGSALKNEQTDEKMIADVVLHFPDGKCVIMDSKVSLDGYIDYMNAESDEERTAADKKHLESVRRHIDELSAKEYSAYMKRTNKDALQYMIMYIPVEGAFQLFFQNHQEEWHKAYDKQIIITSDLYVLTMLKVIQMAWGEYKRNKNYDKIMDASRILLERVYGFTKSFDEIGKGIDKMQKSFSDASKRLHEGPKSIDRSYARLTELGVETKNVLTSGDDNSESEISDAEIVAN
jgi:Uncharacterized protein conserved in bacteria